MDYTINVLYENKPCYDILIRKDFSDLAAALSDMNSKTYKRVCIVADSNTAPLYLDEVKNSVAGVFEEVHSFVFPAGEASKTLDTVQDLYEELIRDHFDRKDLLIALGGGVVGDLTGYAAATYMRGIDFVQVPTTLLAQVDSSVGGKTGVDFRSYKNMVGAFLMPQLVYMNISTLLSLDEEQFACGMGEIIKHGLIRDKDYYEWLKDNASDIEARDLEAISYMVSVSAKIKRDVVQEDPKEMGIRSYLNFGHTLGHAVEKLSGFRLYHGQSVAIGMAAALYLSMKQGRISSEEMKEALNVIEGYHLPVKIPSNITMTPEEVLAASKSDKKMAGSKVKFIVLDSIGTADSYMDFSDADLLEAIQTIR